MIKRSPTVEENRKQQARNLLLLAAIGVLIAIGITVLGAVLYLGGEAPPHDLRTYYTSADGYAPLPLGASDAPAGSVARTSRRYAAPGETRIGSEAAPDPRLADNWQNPLSGDRTAYLRGFSFYQVNCTMCHGKLDTAKPGSVGEAYTPIPPKLAPLVAKRSEGKLYYAITYGIRSTPNAEAARYLPTDWHAFGSLLTPQQRWEIVTYLRADITPAPGH